jgi:hypothetical protein
MDFLIARKPPAADESPSADAIADLRGFGSGMEALSIPRLRGRNR